MNIYRILSFVVSAIHQIIIYGNTIAVLFLIIKQPWYIWLPVGTCILSPLLGGSLCIMNRLENKLRIKAGLKPKDFDGVIIKLLHEMYGWKQSN